jgi:hypothetical protein
MQTIPIISHVATLTTWRHWLCGYFGYLATLANNWGTTVPIYNPTVTTLKMYVALLSL